MAKKEVKRTPSTKARAGASRTTRAKVRDLLPDQGKAAKEKQDAVRFALYLFSLIGGDHQEGRPIALRTSINELKSLRLSEAERDCLFATMRAEAEHAPKTGFAMGYRLELAAAFLSMVIHQAYDAAAADDTPDPDTLAHVALDLAVARAREIWAEDDGGD